MASISGHGGVILGRDDLRMVQEAGSMVQQYGASQADLEQRSLEVTVLGPARHPSPLTGSGVDDGERVLVSARTRNGGAATAEGPSFELAGPRRALFFEPGRATLAVVTCGGLCPGLNDVVRAVTMTAVRRYGVRRVLGYRFGYAGVAGLEPGPIELDADAVDDIHRHGGTLLGSSRGPQPLAAMLATLQDHGVDALVCIGGDGTLRGAAALAAAAAAAGLPLAVVGVPKTIDNDLQWVERSFGFATGVEEAGRAIAAAHAEARGARNGIGLVKLMGRHSGFIAAHATLAFPDVNLCLVPEVPFDPEVVIEHVARRLGARGHAVIVVAEGAGQELLHAGPAAHDASGNARLGDIGAWLRARLERDLGPRLGVTVKYLDPSYAIRSCPANAVDAEFCAALGMHAVHAALAGRTDLMIGFWNQHFTHIPLAVATGCRRRLDPAGDVWERVLHTTGQPARLH